MQGDRQSSRSRCLRRIARVLALACSIAMLGLIALCIYADRAVDAASAGLLYTDSRAVPTRDVGLVLGSARRSRYFDLRIRAAAELYHAGKVRHLLVSGDNHVATYDEPTDMKAALIERGVPADCITCDYAGFRTLDSIVRARDVFGQRRLTVISQAFHNRRAVYLAKARGVDAVAFNAGDVGPRYHRRTGVREVLARAVAVLDVHVFRRQPKFLGPEVQIALQPGSRL